MPSVMIWKPEPPENTYGHAALHTDKYHISLWPDGCLSDKRRQTEAAVGVDGAIVFAQEADKDLEGNRLPDFEHFLKIVTDSYVNQRYEEFLRYNGINPSHVSLCAAKKILDEWCTDEERDRRGKDFLHEKLSIKLPKTPYTYLGRLSSHPNDKYYKFGQSCATLCYHLIRHSCIPGLEGMSSAMKLTSQIAFDRILPFPLKIASSLASNNSPLKYLREGIEIPLPVLEFSDYVEKYYL